MPIDRNTFREITQMITPLAVTAAEQKALVDEAFMDAPRLRPQITVGENAAVFASLLVRKCLDYGEIAPGEPALSAVLDWVYDRSDDDQRDRIDTIQVMLRQHTAPVKLNAAPPPVERVDLPPANNEDTLQHIFVSYASADRHGFVENYVDQLHEAGYAVWVDNLDPAYGGIVASENWKQSLANALNAASLLNLIVTPESVRSKWVHAEVRRAQELGKPVLPLVVRELDDESKAAFALMQINDLHHVNLVRMGYDQALRRVLDDLARLNVPRRPS